MTGYNKIYFTKLFSIGKIVPMIIDLLELREKERVFESREDAGQRLSDMLADYKDCGGIVLAIPAGGVAVGAAIAENLNLALDVAVVSKVTPAWNSEVGFGAVAFDGTVRLNEEMLPQFGLSDEQIKERVKFAAAKVGRRVKTMREGRRFPELAERTVFLVDDGIASGFTLRVAVEAIKGQGASEVIIAVPTGHLQAIKDLEKMVKAIYCANVRSGRSFAVADAYQRWFDVDEEEVLEILKEFEHRN